MKFKQLTNVFLIGFLLLQTIYIVFIFKNNRKVLLLVNDSLFKNPLNSNETNLANKEEKSNENTIKYDFLSKYPDILKCKLDYVNDIGDGYIKEANKETHNLRIIRGILFYFHIERSDHYASELKWLYRSWIEMQKHEPAKWRTDLLVFVENNDKYLGNSDFFLHQLNCSFTNIRKSDEDLPMCTLIDYKPLHERTLFKLDESSLYDSKDENKYFINILDTIDIFKEDETQSQLVSNLMVNNFKDYPYADSIVVAYDGYKFFKSSGYNFLIRTDIDVFLTPMFGKWTPKKCNDFYTGRGAYSEIFNMKRLRRVARRLGLSHAFEENFGSTWYSTPEQFRLASFLTVFTMAYIASEEFSLPEREGKLGVMLWPYWHYGVLSMYGLHMAFNHLMANNFTIVKIPDHMDYPTSNSDSINDKLHYHVFHTDEMFSKFQFQDGKYDNIDYNKEDTTKSRFYCLKMALEGKKIPPKDLYKAALVEAAKKS